MNTDPYQALTNTFEKIYQINHAIAMLCWDEAVMMPEKSGAARAKSVTTLKSMAHDLLTSKDLPEQIDKAKSLILDNWQQRNLALIEKSYLEANCLDNAFVEAYSHACMACEQGWRQYRAENNWQAFKPLLADVVSLTREKAQRKAQQFKLSPYDALIDEFSPGVSQAMIDPLFDKLKKILPGKVENVLVSQPTCINFEGQFDIQSQEQLGKDLMSLLGFDFGRGRLDVSHHPFCGGVPEDIRITTRYQTSEFMSAVMGVCHETGHALYESNLPTAFSGQPVGQSFGMSVHESQSLFIEMQICRSKPFIALLQQKLVAYFGNQSAFELENLYQHYIHVAKGLIRIDADELTYPLHIILRYELEKKLINQDCEVEDLPELWDEYMQKFLHLSTKGNDKDGVMQDVHWPSGAFGYFPAYTLGALIAAQLAERMHQDLPQVNQQLDASVLQSVSAWLGNHIHQWGSRYSVDELMCEATGQSLTADAFLRLVEKRYAC